MVVMKRDSFAGVRLSAWIAGQLLAVGMSIVIMVFSTPVSWGQNVINVVSPAELEGVEGNRSAGGGPVGKLQFLYFADDFLSLPASHRTITGFAWRPDGDDSFTMPVSGPAQFRLSTTDANGLRSTFAENIGNDETLVFDGMLTWQDHTSGAGPRDFEFFVPFDNPFHYDPSSGNLLMEFVSPARWDNVRNWNVDEQAQDTGPITAVATGDLTAAIASFSHRAIWPAEFRFVPEPSSSSLTCLGTIALFRCARRNGRRQRIRNTSRRKNRRNCRWR